MGRQGRDCYEKPRVGIMAGRTRWFLVVMAQNRTPTRLMQLAFN